MKKYLLAFLAVFVAWSVLDFVIHGMILVGVYEATAPLWRPMEDFRHVSGFLATAVTALAFTAIYAYMVRGRSAGAGIRYGLVFGVGTGFSMGFGSYAFMPIPYALAWGWLLGAVLEAAVAGLIVGAIYRAKG